MGPKFIVTTDGKNKLHMKELCQQFADELRMPVCFTKAEAAHYVLELFRRSIVNELDLLKVSCKVDGSKML
jgi:hypothetical protein